ncbi:hypothetical protein GGI25_003634 [Coemansia spiralis]|uniref:Uncharacterized protein n=2 Tax=Coemansia TaxID=4863 RepID=A0A9W8G7Q7_9FUNG|nr:hypothetical protein BX070DRAFT_233450 [Coemansia spiralis]KAJ1996137.1 hypothetical protein EDC05_000027 [Coemansia umbellata]KAJ2626106.1 hypothetical protein GGI26_000190 [Coemansia sp. RSA 1358]KAJ2676247.1 hypothetical protein GGI25_003634 [Coemansia spiralis]
MNRALAIRGANNPLGLFKRAAAKTTPARLYSSQHKKTYYKDPDPQIGDYPNLEQRFAEERSPYVKWWDRQMRRNFGEPIQEQDEILNMWAPTQYWSPGWKQVGKMWAGAILIIGSVYYFIAKTRPEAPYMRAYYPNGLKDELGGLPTRTLAASIEEASK